MLIKEISQTHNNKYYIFDNKKRIIAIIVDKIICRLFCIVRLKKKSSNYVLHPSTINRILIIQLDRIGDTVMSIPVYSNLKRTFPHAQLTALVRPISSQLIKYNNNLYEIICHDPPWWSSSRGVYKYFNFIKEYIKLFKILRRKKFDVSIELRGDLRHILLYSFLPGCRYRIGYSRSGGEYLLTRHLDYNPSIHQIMKNLDLLKFLGIHKPTKSFNISTIKGVENSLNIAFSKYRIDNNSDKVVVHPGASKILMQWPTERFAKLIDWLNNSFGFDVILVGSREEKELCQRILTQTTTYKPIIMAGNLTLIELTMLLKRARLFIGNDSGPMHIADAIGVPIVALFGPSNPLTFGPVSSNAETIFNKFPCCPCEHVNCPISTNGVISSCMDTITLDSVRKAILKLNLYRIKAHT